MMFEYFPNNYPWSLAVMGALNRGGQISEIDEACRPLKEFAATKNDPAAQDAWFESWMKLAERVERLGDVDYAGEPSALRRPQIPARGPLLSDGRAHAEPQGSAPADRLQARHRGLRQGAQAAKEPVECVEVPYGEHRLPAYFMKAPVNGPGAMHGAFRRLRRHQGDHL